MTICKNSLVSDYYYQPYIYIIHFFKSYVKFTFMVISRNLFQQEGVLLSVSREPTTPQVTPVTLRVDTATLSDTCSVGL